MARKKELYFVTAYRWGDRELHSYFVGAFSTKQKALNAAEAEQQYRGGKYECEVLEGYLDKGQDEKTKSQFKVIKRIGS